jgi:hypothetical protein
MTLRNYFGGWLDEASCYEWGNLFASSWDRIVASMAEKAAGLGLRQVAGDHSLTWMSGKGEVECRFVFIDDPSNIEVVRRAFNDDTNAAAGVCYLIVRQPESRDTRGDVVFDIFKMSGISYLCHENRVYTPTCGRKTP